MEKRCISFPQRFQQWKEVENLVLSTTVSTRRTFKNPLNKGLSMFFHLSTSCGISQNVDVEIHVPCLFVETKFFAFSHIISSNMVHDYVRVFNIEKCPRFYAENRHFSSIFPLNNSDYLKDRRMIFNISIQVSCYCLSRVFFLKKRYHIKYQKICKK